MRVKSMTKTIEWVRAEKKPRKATVAGYSVELGPSVPDGRLVMKKAGTARLDTVGSGYRFTIVQEPQLEFSPAAGDYGVESEPAAVEEAEATTWTEPAEPTA